MLLPLQGVNTMAIRTPRVSLRLPWARRFWAFSPCIIGCASAIQASLIAFDLHDNSARALSAAP